jgi:hypothetical protein
MSSNAGCFAVSVATQRGVPYSHGKRPHPDVADLPEVASNRARDSNRKIWPRRIGGAPASAGPGCAAGCLELMLPERLANQRSGEGGDIRLAWRMVWTSGATVLTVSISALRCSSS